jgi:Rrf2 family protein
MTAVADPLASTGARIPVPAATERTGRLVPLRVSAKTDYALRAMAELAATDGTALLKAEAISQAQGIPLRFLLNILNELRHARIVRSHRGADGGYQLARPAREVTVADVVVAMEGSLTTVQGAYPDELSERGAARSLAKLWQTVDQVLRDLLDSVTVADVASGSIALSAGLPLPAGDTAPGTAC